MVLKTFVFFSGLHRTLRIILRICNTKDSALSKATAHIVFRLCWFVYFIPIVLPR